MGGREYNMERYHYDLPVERIAMQPEAERASSRLLCFDGESMTCNDAQFRDLPDLLPSGAILLGNNTRVIPARLDMKRTTGGRVEIFLVDPVEPSTDPSVALCATGRTTWSCMVRGLKRLNLNEVLGPWLLEGRADVSARLVSKDDRYGNLEFSWDEPHRSFADVINDFGHVPLPPYIDRDENDSDREDYQTVYALRDGAVAAPTAGLHFTPDLLDRLHLRGISTDHVTLHVGAGTFAPVTTSSALDHTMHMERFEVSCTLLRNLLEHARRGEPAPVVHVGTTTLRTLESLFWIGEKMLKENLFRGSEVVTLEQWYALDRLDSGERVPDRREVLEYLVGEMEARGLESMSGETSLMILPGYQFQMCDQLITNFHQPGSTLILLVAAFLGEKGWKVVYDHALENEYRFLSYGDGSLLVPPPSQ